MKLVGKSILSSLNVLANVLAILWVKYATLGRKNEILSAQYCAYLFIYAAEVASKRFRFAALVDEFASFAEIVDKELVKLDLFEILGKNVANGGLLLPIFHPVGQLASEHSLVEVPNDLKMAEQFDTPVGRERENFLLDQGIREVFL